MASLLHFGFVICMLLSYAESSVILMSLPPMFFQSTVSLVFAESNVQCQSLMVSQGHKSKLVSVLGIVS